MISAMQEDNVTPYDTVFSVPWNLRMGEALWDFGVHTPYLALGAE